MPLNVIWNSPVFMMKPLLVSLALANFLIPSLSAIAPSPEQSTILQGTLAVGGQRFIAACDCRSPERGLGSNIGGILCNPNKISIIADHGTEGLTNQDIRRIYGQPRDIEMVDVGYQKFACMDDRIAEPSLLTPGGDLGEFLLGLNILTNSNSQNPLAIDTQGIVDMMTRYVQSLPPTRRFYHCNDDLSVSHLEKTLSLVGLDLTQPSDTQKEALKQKLKDPQNHGDIHLRSILSHPERYHISLDLAVNTVLSFYTILWDQGNAAQTRLLLDVLPGMRNPQAFIEVDEGQLCTQTQRAPLFRPRISHATKTTSALIVHTAAVSHRRKDIANFLEGEAQRLKSNMTSADIYSRMEKYGLQWLEATVAAVAKDLKFYRMTFL